MTQLAFQGITKSLGAVRALRDVTFSVAEGEMHTFESICGCPRERMSMPPATRPVAARERAAA
jgi:hypothetical protein